MDTVSPDLAAKVNAASLRNQVKAVGEGAVLPQASQQTFMTYEVNGDPAAMQKARETALLQKWLIGGRLSKEEKDEIEHVLPQALTAAAAAAPKGNGYHRSADDYMHIGVARRTFFRWKAAGESNADGPDLPPFDDPAQLEAWYERMRARGVFKHKFPKDVRLAISEHLRGSLPASTAPKAASSSASGPASGESAPDDQVPRGFTDDHGAALGLAYEIAAEEKRVAGLRVARDECYAQQKRTDGDAYDRRYREALDALSLIQQRYLKIAEQEGRLVPVEMIEREFGPIISTVVTSGMLLWDKIAARIRELPDPAAQRALWRKSWIEHCTGLVEGRFAPLLNLEMLTA